MIKLSDRMQLISDMVKPGAAVADIGTDHGFIPIYLKQSCRASRIILTDIADGPLAKTRENLGKYGIEENENFCIRKGSGIQPIHISEVDTVIIAGMGGELISSILEADIEKAKSFEYLILQPRTMCDKLRKWLDDNGFKVIEEHLIEEGPQLAQLLMAVPDEKLRGNKFQIYSDSLDYEIAPLLFDGPDKNLKQLLKRSIRHAKLVSFNLKSAKIDSADNKLSEWQQRIKELNVKLTKL